MMVHALGTAEIPCFPRVPKVRRLRAVSLCGSKLMGTAEYWNAKLLAVAERGDREAFGELFAYYAPRVKTYLLKMGAGAAAEELAQEAMLSLWRKAALFDPAKASAGTWIFAIARNLRVDAIRRERRPALDPDDPELSPVPEPLAEDGLMTQEKEARLRAALVQLPVEQAEIVTLSFFADKPHSQIAEELKLPLGTVKSRLRLAMGRLRAALGDEP